MPRKKALQIDCGPHGRRVAAVVCVHIARGRRPVGFVENSDDPDDLQAWCDRCEAMFLAEGDMTPAFEAFHDLQVVCAECYAGYKARHTRAGRG